MGEAVPLPENPKPYTIEILRVIGIDYDGNIVETIDDERLSEFRLISNNSWICEGIEPTEEEQAYLNKSVEFLNSLGSLEEISPSYADMEVYDVYYLSVSESIAKVLEKGGYLELNTIDENDYSKCSFVGVIRSIDGEFIESGEEYIEALEDGTLVHHLNLPEGVYALIVDPNNFPVENRPPEILVVISITFDANGGTFPTSGEAQKSYGGPELTGSTALSSIVETPTKPGYVFKGWSNTSTGAVQYTQASMPTISSDTTLYAIYEPDTTKVLLEKRCCRYNSWKVEMMIRKEG